MPWQAQPFAPAQCHCLVDPPRTGSTPDRIRPLPRREQRTRATASPLPTHPTSQLRPPAGKGKQVLLPPPSSDCRPAQPIGPSSAALGGMAEHRGTGSPPRDLLAALRPFDVVARPPG